MNEESNENIKFYESIGFSRNPFETNTAEREPEIEKYVVRPPYLDPVEASSRNTGSFTLAGSRGSGKSATRITVQRNIWQTSMPHMLPVALTNFSQMRGKHSPEKLLDIYADQIFFLVIEAVLIHLSSIGESESNAVLERISSGSKKFIDYSLKNYYFNRSAEHRNNSAHECFEMLAVSYSRRGVLWVNRRWNELSGALAGFAVAVGKRFDIDLGDSSDLKGAIAGPASTDQNQEPLYVLTKAVEFARLFGFSGVLVQVDKIDETDWTGNNVEAAANLIWPLYSNIQLHEISNLSWSFFLWDRVRSILVSENDMPVRWDKLPNERIKWDEKYLKKMVESRVSFFSNKTKKKLSDIFVEGINEDDIYKELFSVSGLSPRNLITIINSMIIYHIQSSDGKFELLNMNSVHQGLDNYVSLSLLDNYMPDTLRQLQKLALTQFVNRDVSKAFAISSPGAKQKIDKWINSGIANRSGQVFSGGRVKPVDQFVISEPRIKRFVERKLQIPESA